MMRRDVIEAAADRQDILFLIFTNGTMLDDTTENLEEVTSDAFLDKLT